MSEIILSQPEKVKLDGMVRELVDSLTRSEAEKSFRKDVGDRAKEELGIKPALLNQIAAERFNDSITEKLAKLEEVVDLNDELISAAKNTG